jgi:hypothetical protein
MPEIRRKTEENIEDVQRISDTLKRRVSREIRKDKKKNPFLLPGGGINLVETWPSYENKKKRKSRGDNYGKEKKKTLHL